MTNRLITTMSLDHKTKQHWECAARQFPWWKAPMTCGRDGPHNWRRAHQRPQLRRGTSLLLSVCSRAPEKGKCWGQRWGRTQHGCERAWPRHVQICHLAQWIGKHTCTFQRAHTHTKTRVAAIAENAYTFNAHLNAHTIAPVIFMAQRVANHSCLILLHQSAIFRARQQWPLRIKF